MKVVLLVDVKKLGTRGSVITVADGYAMNVLIPQKKAVTATEENIQKVEKAALAAVGKREMDAALAQKALAEISGKTYTVSAKANDAGGLFESIREKQIADAVLKGSGISLPESAFQLSEPIKKTGTHEVPIVVQGLKTRVALLVLSA